MSFYTMKFMGRDMKKKTTNWEEMPNVTDKGEYGN